MPPGENRCSVDTAAVEYRRRAGLPQPYPSGRHPVVELVNRLAQRDGRALIAV